jgi:hypothetical protein
MLEQRSLPNADFASLQHAPSTTSRRSARPRRAAIAVACPVDATRSA